MLWYIRTVQISRRNLLYPSKGAQKTLILIFTVVKTSRLALTCRNTWLYCSSGTVGLPSALKHPFIAWEEDEDKKVK